MPSSLRLKPVRDNTPVAAQSGEGINHGSTSEPPPAYSNTPDPNISTASAPPFGLKVWCDPQDAMVDICFVHGLTGDRDSTWIARGQTEPWPKTLLAPEIPKARLLSYGYQVNTLYSSDASQNQLHEHAVSLITAINEDREAHGASKRHIIFVAHTTGGLVCERALLLSRRRCLFGSIIGFVLMGAFHQDAWLADGTKLPLSPSGLSNLTNKLASRSLSQTEDFIKSVKKDFFSTLRWEHRNARDLCIMCFYEKIPVSGIGDVGLKDSAIFPGLTPVSILACRSNIVRFRSPNDASFTRFTGELERLIKQLKLDEFRSRNYRLTQRPINMTSLEVTTGRTCAPYYYLPLKRDGDFTFVGRESFLSSLREGIFARNHSREFALCGHAGIGKTQTAWQLVTWTKYNKPEYSIIWLSALSGATLTKQCAEIVSELGLKISTESEKPHDTVKRYMSSKASGRWLLIIDDVDNEEVALGSDRLSGVYNSLPQSNLGLTLCITFSKEIASKLTVQENIFELPAMLPEQALVLLNQALGGDPVDDNWAAKTLLVRLAFLPLAIKQAASYITSTRITITKYLEILDGVEEESVEFFNQDIQEISHYRESLRVAAATFLVSFYHILKKDVMATKLLNLLACIEPGSISLALLSELHSNIKLELVIGTLCGYSFLSQREDGELFDMHRLIHLAIRKRNDQSNSGVIMTNLAAKHLWNLCKETTRESKHIWRPYLPHILKLLRSERAMDSDKTVPLISSAAQYLVWDGHHDEAVVLLERANTYGRELRLKNDTWWLTARHNLAITYLKMKEYDKALQLLTYILSRKKYPYRSSIQQTIAETYASMGRVEDSIPLFEEVVSIKRKTCSEEDVGKFKCEHDLARAYLAVHRNQSALEILERIVPVQRRNLPEEHSIRSRSEYSLARTYVRLKRYEEAVDTLKYVISIEGRRLAEDHPNRLEVQCELASTYSTMGRYQEAADLLECVVSVKRATLPEDYPGLLFSQTLLASRYSDLGRHQEAADLLEHVVTVKQTSLPETDLGLNSLRCQLAHIYEDMQRYEEAVEIFEHVVSVLYQSCSEDNFHLISCQRRLSWMYFLANRGEEATDLLEHILPLVQKGPVNSCCRIDIEDQLAKTYNGVHLYHKAISLLEEIVPLRKKVLSEDHKNLLIPQFELSCAYRHVERTRDAMKLLKHVVSVKRKNPKAYKDLRMNERVLGELLNLFIEEKLNRNATGPGSASQNREDQNLRVDKSVQTKECDQIKEMTQADENDQTRGGDQTNEDDNAESLAKPSLEID